MTKQNSPVLLELCKHPNGAKGWLVLPRGQVSLHREEHPSAEF